MTLSEALDACGSAGHSGVVHVAGEPGGTIHFADGAITAIQTPGAPSAEVILLRSRLVTESGWDEAFTAAAKSGTPMGAELVARDILGTGELEVLLRTVLADAMFVMASGHVDGCHAVAGPADYLLPLRPGAKTRPLLAEATRRILLLGSMRFSPGSERVVAVPPAARRTPLDERQEEILALADGRRTARDIAFALGRGVYATMLDVAELGEAGVLTIVPRSGRANAAASPPPYGSGAGSRSGTAGQPETPAGLPVRRKGPPRRSAEPGAAHEVPGLHRLLRPRTGKSADPGESGRPGGEGL
jgi:hypothetical protein